MNPTLWRLATGAPWRDLPPEYGSWRTVCSRFRRWQQAGVFERVRTDLQRAGDVAGDLDWTLHFVDGSVVRAHQLTRWEVEVLRPIAAGRVNEAVPAELSVSLNTVERHINHIFAKAGVGNRVEAANYARQHGLVPRSAGVPRVLCSSSGAIDAKWYSAL